MLTPNSIGIQSFFMELKSVSGTQGVASLELTVDIARRIRVISAEVLACESMMLLCPMFPTPSSDSR